MNKGRYKVLHITPHLGGGVGTVVLNYVSKAGKDHWFRHEIICLDYANEDSIKISKKIGFGLWGNMSKRKPEILKMVAEADLVLIHLWNHPLLFDFLVREKLPESRVIFWSHVSGFAPPNNFTDKLLKYPDVFVFTTPISHHAKEVASLPSKCKKNVRVIWSTGGSERLKSMKPRGHSGFNIGYMGTVDYSKMHPDFVKMSSAVKIPGAQFIVMGGPNEKKLREEAEKLGVAEKFNFTGFVAGSRKWRMLSTFDIFGYPLASRHFGSSDQVLQEAMTVGIVPVVFDNLMESYMVKNGETGIVVKNKKAYVRALEKLYSDNNLRKRLSRNARVYARHEFSLEKMKKEWLSVFEDTMKLPKRRREWRISKPKGKVMPRDIFLESLGDYGKPFVSYCKARNSAEKKIATERIRGLAESPSWQSKSKGTAHQYNTFLPGDKYLSFWSKLM